MYAILVQFILLYSTESTYWSIDMPPIVAHCSCFVYLSEMKLGQYEKCVDCTGSGEGMHACTVH